MTEQTSNAEPLLERLQSMSPAERVTWLREQRDVEPMLLQLAETASKLAISEADRALSLTELVIDLSDELGLDLARCRARRARVRALSYNGRYAEALRVCGTSADIASESGIPEEIGRARLAQMHPLVEMGRIGDALAAGEAARSTFVQAGLSAMAARADINLGVVHQKGDAPRRAVQCFDRARGALADEPLTIGHLENNRGEALLLLNDFQGAERAFAGALEAFEREGVHLTAAIAAGNLADLAVRQGRLARAMRHFEHARRALEAAGSPTHLARVLAEQAEAQSMLGLTDQALRQFEQSLAELDRSGCQIEAAPARSGMGMTLLQAGRLAEAETALAAAATGFDQLGHRSARARVDLVRAEMVAHHGRHREARQMALNCVAVLHDRPADAIAARHLLARIAEATGHREEARAELDAAVATAQRFNLAPVLADLLHTRGKLHRHGGDTASAIADLRRAVENVERVRGSLQAQRFRTAFFGQRAALHEELIDLLVTRSAEGDLIEAFNIAEASKSRVLLDRLSGAFDADGIAADSATTQDTTHALHQQLSQHRYELNGLYSRLADGALNLGDDDALTTWRVRVRHLEAEIAELEDRLAATHAGGIFARPITLKQLQQSLGAGEVVLEYIVLDGAITVFCITADSAGVERDIASVDTVRAALEQLEFQVNRGLRPGSEQSPQFAKMIRNTQSVLQQLHQLLIEPVADCVRGARKLTFVPHGPLHAAPLHALHDGGRYLIEQCAVHVAPSASVLMHCGADQTTRCGDGVLVAGVDDAHGQHMVQEARAVAELFERENVTGLFNGEATVGNVTAALERVQRAHIACHGHFLSDSPQGAGLKLSDRWMTVLDIVSMRTNADLIVLSGCETGLSNVESGDELTGVAGALLAAGARSVLVALWRVDDASAVELMRTLNRNLDAGSSLAGRKANALRTAQLEMMKRHPHPAHWAPFTLTGEA